MGIELNQQTRKLLDKKDRDIQDDNRIIAFAKASLYHWQKSHEFQPVNEQRGEWMISHVYAILEQGNDALHHAEKCWVLTKELNLGGFDLGYAYEALARAHAILGHSEKMNDCFLQAKSAREKLKVKKIEISFYRIFMRVPSLNVQNQWMIKCRI